MEELGCGKVSSTHVDVNTGNSIEPVEMKMSVEKVNQVLGIQVPDEDILRILDNLQFAPAIQGDELTIQVPAFREDVESYPDIAEEVIRMYGYDHVISTFMPSAKVTTGGMNKRQKTTAFREDVESYPDIAEEVIRMYGYDHVISTFMPSAKVTTGGMNKRQKTTLKVKKALCSAGAYEGIHYSFFSPSDLDMLNLPADAPERHAIRLMNPINEDLSLMRTTLAPGMIHAMARNQKRGTLEGRIFEVGSKFIPKELPPINEDLSLMRTTLAPGMIHAMARNQKRGTLEGRIFEVGSKFIPKELPLTEYPDERETLCVGVFGKEESFFTLKGLAETVADALCLNFTYEPAQKTYLHPYQTASVHCNGEEVGYLGKVSYEIQDSEDMRVSAYVMELDLETLSRWYGITGYLGKVSYEIQDSEDMRVSAYVMELDLETLSRWYGITPVFEPLPKFQEEKRDLALVMDKAVTCGQIEDCIKESCKYVKSVELFDVYEGKQIQENQKSMAFTVLFTPKEEEFTANAVDGFVKKILKNLDRNLQVTLRS